MIKYGFYKFRDSRRQKFERSHKYAFKITTPIRYCIQIGSSAAELPLTVCIDMQFEGGSVAWLFFGNELQTP